MRTFNDDVLVNGSMRIEKNGDGAVLLTLDTERGWVFRQRGTGAGTALELTASNPDNNNKHFLINTDGRVGIGTVSPDAKLHVDGGAIEVSNQGDGAVLLTLESERGWRFRQRGTGAGTALELTASNPANNNKHFLINTDGRVGIGTVNPLAKLHVEGSVRVTDDVVLVGADCAEDFEIEPNSMAGAGTVMVIESAGRLRHSSVPYDKRVAGVVSGDGGRRPGIVLGRRDAMSGGSRVPIALTGTVYCNVDATASPIDTGDLLTTSARPGHAMRVSDGTRALGAVLGKALEGLASGVGTIPVLVALH